MNEQDASLALALDNSAFDAKARILLKAEPHLITSGMDYTILRCKSLIGPKRHHHALFFKWQKSADSRQQICCICMTRMVLLIFARAAPYSIINATTPNTVSKAEFYQAALDVVPTELPLPPLCDKEEKRIVCDKLLAAGYRFNFSHTLVAVHGYE